MALDAVMPSRGTLLSNAACRRLWPSAPAGVFLSSSWERFERIGRRVRAARAAIAVDANRQPQRLVA